MKKRKYDEQVVDLLSDKGILAGILGCAGEEFRGDSLEEIKKSISDRIEIAPEGEQTYDFKFYAKDKNRIKRCVYVNFLDIDLLHNQESFAARGVELAYRLSDIHEWEEWTSEGAIRRYRRVSISMNIAYQDASSDTIMSKRMIEFSLEHEWANKNNTLHENVIEEQKIFYVIFLWTEDSEYKKL